MEILDRLTGL